MEVGHERVLSAVLLHYHSFVPKHGDERYRLFVEKDKSNGDISNVSAMHIRAMDFEPFSFRINDNAIPELLEGFNNNS